mgnify:CR=1 FL=1
MIKAILVILLISSVMLIGCVDQPEPYTPPPQNNTDIEEQPEDVPMPDSEDVNRGENPEFPF